MAGSWYLLNSDRKNSNRNTTFLIIVVLISMVIGILCPSLRNVHKIEKKNNHDSTSKKTDNISN